VGFGRNGKKGGGGSGISEPLACLIVEGDAVRVKDFLSNPCTYLHKFKVNEEGGMILQAKIHILIRHYMSSSNFTLLST